jgi:hypothetical protein
VLECQSMQPATSPKLDNDSLHAAAVEAVAFATRKTKTMGGMAVMTMASYLRSGSLASMDEHTRTAVLGFAVDLFIAATK